MIGDFKNRAEAGRQLGAAVQHLDLIDPLVLALPRGGVPVAAEVALALGAPLDLLVVRKIGAPGEPELAVAVAGRTVVVVDDGIATGTTMRAALQALRRMRPEKVVLAVPVASNHTIYELAKLVDDVVCLSQPGHFRSVGTYYADFHQVDDAEVIALLDASRIPHQHEPEARALRSGEAPLVLPSRSEPPDPLLSR